MKCYCCDKDSELLLIVNEKIYFNICEKCMKEYEKIMEKLLTKNK